MIMEYLPAVTLPNPLSPERLRRLGERLGDMHRVPLAVEPSLHKMKRRVGLARASQFAARANAAPLAEAINAYNDLRASLRTLGLPAKLCHNDLNPTNILFTESDVFFIDFDHVGMGDPLFDVATVWECLKLTPAQGEVLLESYLDDAPDASITARLQLLRVLVLLRYGILTVAMASSGIWAAGGFAAADPGRSSAFEYRGAELDHDRAIANISWGFLRDALQRLASDETVRARAALLL